MKVSNTTKQTEQQVPENKPSHPFLMTVLYIFTCSMYLAYLAIQQLKYAKKAFLGFLYFSILTVIFYSLMLLYVRGLEIEDNARKQQYIQQFVEVKDSK